MSSSLRADNLTADTSRAGSRLWEMSILSALFMLAGKVSYPIWFLAEVMRCVTDVEHSQLR